MASTGKLPVFGFLYLFVSDNPSGSFSVCFYSIKGIRCRKQRRFTGTSGVAEAETLPFVFINKNKK
jgi:hypothetical protein